MIWLLAVDPGLDATGVAAFDLTDWRPGISFQEAIARLGPTIILRTKPTEPLVVRLEHLSREFHDFGDDCPGGLARILIEQPATAGAYAARRRRQGTKGLINGAALAKLHMAVGTLVGAATTHSELQRDGALLEERVLLVPAPRIEKRLRQKYVLVNLGMRNHPLAAQTRRPSPDLLDAIYLGATWLSSVQRLSPAA